jgi:hypothetical protein
VTFAKAAQGLGAAAGVTQRQPSGRCTNERGAAVTGRLWTMSLRRCRLTWELAGCPQRSSLCDLWKTERAHDQLPGE